MGESAPSLDNVTEAAVKHVFVFGFGFNSEIQYWSNFLMRVEGICKVVRFAISNVGILGNLLTARTFLLLGLKDSVAICFFNLAISDLLLVSFDFVYGVRVVFNLRGNFVTYFDHLRDIFLNSTVLLTSFLAIQRCLCVMLPLHFKGMFTRTRTLIIVLILWAYCLPQGLMNASNMVYSKVWENNNTYFYYRLLYPSRTLHQVNEFMKQVNGLALRPAMSILLIICIFLMANSLRKSAKFRKSAATDERFTSTQKDSKSKSGSDGMGANDKEEKTKRYTLSSKETQAILQVTLVSSIFVLTSVQQIEFPVTILLSRVARLSFKRMYQINIVRYVGRLLSTFNSSCNFFIYYTFNTKFRQLCFRRAL